MWIKQIPEHAHNKIVYIEHILRDIFYDDNKKS